MSNIKPKTSANFQKAVTGDYVGTVDFLNKMPYMGFFGTLWFCLVHIALSILGLIGTLVMIYLLLAYVLPALFFM